MLWPKKNSYKEFANEKKFRRLENSPPPPITFLMVRPLPSIIQITNHKSVTRSILLSLTLSHLEI